MTIRWLARSRAWLGRLVVAPETDGDRARTVVGTFVLHLRPVRVPRAAIRYTHTFGLGGMSLVLVGVLGGRSAFTSWPHFSNL